jgi:hypothetical protein
MCCGQIFTGGVEWAFSEVRLITFNTNLVHLSDTPTPLTGVCCTRYVARGSHVKEQNASLALRRGGKEVYEMNPTSMLELANRYLNDPHFKEQMRQDSEGSAESTGLKFDDEDRQSIRNWDMSSSGEAELRVAISKGVALN